MKQDPPHELVLHQAMLNACARKVAEVAESEEERERLASLEELRAQALQAALVQQYLGEHEWQWDRDTEGSTQT